MTRESLLPTWSTDTAKVECLDLLAGDMSELSIEVEEEATVLAVLSLLHPEAKKNSLRRMVDAGRVHIDGEKVGRANAIVAIGATLSVVPRMDGDQPKKKDKSALLEPEVIYCDESIVVVSKPAGLLSVATGHGERDTMFDRIKQWTKDKQQTRAYLVHRLDRETSGCMIFARSAEVRESLQSQFKLRSIERIYHALVYGQPEENSGTETLRIKETKDKRVRLVDKGRRGGKEAITHWEVEGQGLDYSLIRIKIDTGRRAQIRLHMAYLGCPVVGDSRHGLGKASINRLCLHASSLSFEHPSGERMTIVAPMSRQLDDEVQRRVG